MFGGRPGDAVPQFEDALRLNPRGVEAFGYLSVGAGALVMLGRYEEAVDWAQRSLLFPVGDQNFWTYAQLASAFGHLGRLDEAREALGELLKRRPEFSRDYMRRVVAWRNDDHFEIYLDGLRKAGLKA
jgi:adenylate cyclase